jgi:hypothetical protein
MERDQVISLNFQQFLLPKFGSLSSIHSVSATLLVSDRRFHAYAKTDR